MITNITWNQHPILKSLKLDLKQSDGSPYNTIILAGENGTGKTSILNTLSIFLNLGSFENFSEIQYFVDNEIYTIKPLEDFENYGFHTRTKNSTNETIKIRTNKDNNLNEIETNDLDLRHYGCSYSKARSGFNTNLVKSSTTQQLDLVKRENDSSDDFTNIKQLLVDISSQDNAEFTSIAKQSDSVKWSDFEPNSRSFRFKNAFNNFFDSIKFTNIDENSQEEKKIIFKKNDSIISIDQLSTGEKQIVFRGTSLLKNSKKITGGIVLIDEPELSMHPKWQEKILDFYRSLYIENNVQTTQLFIATHSEYVIKSALNDSNNVLIIVLKEDASNIIAQPIKLSEMKLPTITSSEINYRAFGIASNDYHTQLYGHLQQITNNLKVKNFDEYIINHSTYNQTKHKKNYHHNSTTYESLPTYIRNCIHHPDGIHNYTDEELKISITLLENIL